MDHFAQSMGSTLLKAAKRGVIDAFKHIPPEELARVLTPLSNTILHVHIMHQDAEKGDLTASTRFVEDILAICPSLLQLVNANGETLFHVAAKYGYLGALEVLIACSKEEKDLESKVSDVHLMLRKTDNDRNTALHLAVLHDKSKVVQFLVREDCDFPYTVNARGETPLYLAAEKKSNKMVDYILDNCPLAAHEGPDGKTALHVAANSYITGKILEKKGKWITHATDRNGWTALHFAAYHGYFSSVTKILEYDASTAIIADKQRKMTALHLAAGQGYYFTMEKIISKCPDCCEMVDIKGWNALHFAMCSLWSFDLKQIKGNPLLKNLMHKKDLKGNIPLRVLSVIHPNKFDRLHLANDELIFQATRGNLEPAEILKQEIQDLSKSIDNGPYYRGMVGINDEEYHDDLSVESEEDLFIREMAEKAKEYHLVVAGLIATVTFTAAFTLPGGFGSEKDKGEGIAVLRKDSAFQAFVVTNTISFVFSLSAVFLHFLISMPRVVKLYPNLFTYAFSCTIIAMVGMVIAFVTGSYAVLSPSLGLAIVICFLGLSFFILVICMARRLILCWFLYNFNRIWHNSC